MIKAGVSQVIQLAGVDIFHTPLHFALILASGSFTSRSYHCEGQHCILLAHDDFHM